VITSNVSSMVEVAGEAALLIDPNSVQSITEGMLSIVNNPTLRDDLVTKGKKRLLNYSWDNTAQTIYNQFKIVSK